MVILTALTALDFHRIRPVAAWLLLPYLTWLIFAATLNGAIVALNPT
jgi:tryptophan-rich sensory protein